MPSMKHVVFLPVIDMRAEPTAQAKMVSQALFGEEIALKGQAGEWTQIATPDRYLGWVRGGIMSAAYAPDAEITRLSAHLYATPDTEYGPLLTLPHGAPLRVLGSGDPRWARVQLPDGREAFAQKGDLAPEPFDLALFSQKFLGLPYLWGGRSSFGFDCSGFVQMLYRRLGILLPRDAREQILDPRALPIALEHLSLGDLIFWGYSEREIKHVGMSLGGARFIHTSVRENRPYVRISDLSDGEWSGGPGAFYPFRAARRWRGG